VFVQVKDKPMLRLTSKMIEMLMDCHERELLNLEPCDINNTKIAKGLLTRGLFSAAMYQSKTTGKRYMALFVTTKGKEYLKTYAAEK
jgi:hypothetical protein